MVIGKENRQDKSLCLCLRTYTHLQRLKLRTQASSLTAPDPILWRKPLKGVTPYLSKEVQVHVKHLGLAQGRIQQT